MLNKSQLIFFSPEDLILLYLGFYNQEFGNNKGVELISKIQTSKKIQDFITKLRVEKLSPSDDGFITIVNSVPYFLFSKGETLGYGALYAIQIWIEQSSNDSFKIDYSIVHRIVIETIFRAEKTKINFTGKHTFFFKYFNLLEDVLNNSFKI